jgi:hypothetical protein
VSGGPDLVAVFSRWIWWRTVLHNGWWLVTSVYLVVDAGLTPSQLVLIGVAQGVIALAFEIPAGVVADTISRRLRHRVCRRSGRAHRPAGAPRK